MNNLHTLPEDQKADIRYMLEAMLRGLDTDDYAAEVLARELLEKEVLTRPLKGYGLDRIQLTMTKICAVGDEAWSRVLVVLEILTDPSLEMRQVLTGTSDMPLNKLTASTIALLDESLSHTLRYGAQD